MGGFFFRYPATTYWVANKIVKNLAPPRLSLSDSVVQVALLLRLKKKISCYLLRMDFFGSGVGIVCWWRDANVPFLLLLMFIAMIGNEKGV